MINHDNNASTFRSFFRGLASGPVDAALVEAMLNGWMQYFHAMNLTTYSQFIDEFRTIIRARALSPYGVTFNPPSISMRDFYTITTDPDLVSSGY